MTDNVHQLRPKPNDSEKVTINLGFVDLGHIDLMVQEGFYSNRTDFIRTAIRNQLERHATSSNSPRRERASITVCGTIAAKISKRRARGEMLNQCLGLDAVAPMYAPEGSRDIPSVVVLGALHASPEVKAALADRVR